MHRHEEQLRPAIHTHVPQTRSSVTLVPRRLQFDSSLVEPKPSIPLTTSIQFELTHLCISGGRIPPQVAGAREMRLTVGAVVRIGKLLPVPLTAASP